MNTPMPTAARAAATLFSLIGTLTIAPAAMASENGGSAPTVPDQPNCTYNGTNQQLCCVVPDAPAPPKGPIAARVDWGTRLDLFPIGDDERVKCSFAPIAREGGDVLWIPFPWNWWGDDGDELPDLEEPEDPECDLTTANGLCCAQTRDGWVCESPSEDGDKVILVFESDWFAFDPYDPEFPDDECEYEVEGNCCRRTREGWVCDTTRGILLITAAPENKSWDFEWVEERPPISHHEDDGDEDEEPEDDTPEGELPDEGECLRVGDIFLCDGPISESWREKR